MKDEFRPEIAEYLISLYIKEEDLVEHMIDGLRKAEIFNIKKIKLKCS